MFVFLVFVIGPFIGAMLGIFLVGSSIFLVITIAITAVVLAFVLLEAILPILVVIGIIWWVVVLGRDSSKNSGQVFQHVTSPRPLWSRPTPMLVSWNLPRPFRRAPPPPEPVPPEIEKGEANQWLEEVSIGSDADIFTAMKSLSPGVALNCIGWGFLGAPYVREITPFRIALDWGLPNRDELIEAKRLDWLGDGVTGARSVWGSVGHDPNEFDYWITERGELLIYHDSQEIRNRIMDTFLSSTLEELVLPLSRIDCLRYRVERRSALPHVPASRSLHHPLADEVNLQNQWFDRHRRQWLDAVPTDLPADEQVDFQVRDGVGFLIRVDTA